jgi:hypothetical protein
LAAVDVDAPVRFKAADTTHATPAALFRSPAHLVIFDMNTGQPTITLRAATGRKLITSLTQLRDGLNMGNVSPHLVQSGKTNESRAMNARPSRASGCTGHRMADGVTNLLPFRAISGPVQGEAATEHPASQEPGKGESTVAIERVGREEACRPRNRGGHGGDKSCVNSRCRGAA